MILQAPAVDVAAIGLANGRVILHNLKYDETVMSFCQDWGAVTTVSFRTGSVYYLAAVTSYVFFDKVVVTQRAYKFFVVTTL